MITEDQIKSALQTVKYPGYNRDIVSFGLVKGITAKNGAVSVTMQLTSGSPEVVQQIKAESERVLKGLAGVNLVHVEIKAPQGPQAAGAGSPWQHQNKVPGIARIVAVASGKGGVGKSTTSVNLACALQQMGVKVGLLDCDIYGPSIPLMMGMRQKPTLSEDETKMIPPVAHGVKLMSMGFLVEGDNPVIWRGPMIMKTIQQFVNSVAWGELDYLLVDLPPGTGDAQLSLCQTVPLDGGIIVTTPQEASLGVVRKGIAMFEKLNVPILGIVENMSYFTTPNGERVEIFGYGGGRAEAERQKINFLGEVPIFTEIRSGGDKGVPVVVSAPEFPPSQAFMNVAKGLRHKLEGMSVK
ncbi:MAG: chromosome partitioning protein [Pedosphaera sp.]|nr:chromosome partitioning protein [Pedosphaera sp.]